MRILHVIDSMDPAKGGPVEVVLRSSESLRAMGHISEVVSLDPPDPPWAANLPLPSHSAVRITSVYQYSPHLTPWMRRHARDYDVVIIHGVWTYATVGAWRALRGGDTPYFVFTHGMLDPWFGKANPVKNVAKQIYWSLLLGPVLRDARAVLFTAEEERRLARTAFFGHRYKEQVVIFGTADVTGDPQRQIDAFRRQMPALDGRKFLLFMGRIHPKKACDLLIRAFAAACSGRPDLDLVIAGPDQVGWRKQLEEIARECGVAERIHWPGMISGDAKWGAFRAAEAFVLASHQENFGIVVAEAMACSRPVLISDKVNIWKEVIETGAAMVSADDQAGVTDLLRRFLQLSPAQREEMGRRGRQRFLEKFEIAMATRDLVRVLQGAI